MPLPCMCRCDGTGSLPRNPKTITTLRRAAKCKASPALTMGADLVLTDSLMGKIRSNSIVYFVCVAGV